MLFSVIVFCAIVKGWMKGTKPLIMDCECPDAIRNFRNGTNSCKGCGKIHPLIKKPIKNRSTAQDYPVGYDFTPDDLL